MGAGARLLYLDLFVTFFKEFKVQCITLTNCGHEQSLLQGKIGSNGWLGRNFNAEVAQRA